MARADSPLRDRVIFVEGAPRSGTTLLASLIGSHPDVAGTVAESHLFDRGINAVLANHAAYLSDYLRRERLLDLCRDLCDGVLIGMRENVKPEASYVAEKTPVPPRGAEDLLAQKLEIYPDAHYVHVVRDQEAVLRSLLRAPWNEQDERGSRAWWRDGVAGIRSVLGGAEHYREVSYDELAADPRGAMGGIYGWLGIAADDEPLDRVAALAHERISSFPATPDERRRGRWLRRGGAAARSARRRLAAGREAGVAPSLAAAQALVVAVRCRDAAEIESRTTDDFELTLRSGGGDAVAGGSAARKLLLEIGRETFQHQFASESWAPIAAGGGSDDPVAGMVLAATRGDGSRVDAFFGARAQGQRIRSLALISAGDLSGRKSSQWQPAS